MEAFRTAVRMGADGVELDVRRTADHALVVHHDPRLADGRLVIEVPRSKLPPYVPTLEEALDACGPLLVNVEIKNMPFEPDYDPDDAVADAVVALVGARARTADVLVSCFHLPTIDRVRDSGAGIRTGYLVIDATTRDAERAVRHGHAAFHPWEQRLTASVVADAHELGLEVNTWTVDDPDRIAELTGWGVDGIVTNTPDVARAVVGQVPS